MNKHEFMGKVKETLELSSIDKANDTVNKLSKLIVDLVKESAARKGRNPQTGEMIDIPAKKAMKFKIAKKAKDSINQ